MQLFERLLREGEGPRLDYKADQYAIVSPGDDQLAIGAKAELIKDIMAMVNAHREVAAFILIGVEQVPGQPARVRGITAHLDDAALHQIVNSKLNRPVDFHYSEFQAGGRTVASIEIPVQRRPVFTTRRFGSLAPDAVYIRRGSSTGIADPEEVFQMGLLSAGRVKPRLDFQVAKCVDRVRLGTKIQQACVLFKPLRDAELPRIVDESQEPYGLTTTLINRDYYRELRDFVVVTNAIAPYGFVVRNDSSTVASDVRAQLRLRHDSRILLIESEPEPPEQYRSISPLRSSMLPTLNPEITIERRGDFWEVNVNFGKVQPGGESWTADELFIGTLAPLDVAFEGRLFGDDFDPVPVEFVVHSAPIERAMTQSDLEAARVLRLEID